MHFPGVSHGRKGEKCGLKGTKLRPQKLQRQHEERRASEGVREGWGVWHGKPRVGLFPRPGGWLHRRLVQYCTYIAQGPTGCGGWDWRNQQGAGPRPWALDPRNKEGHRREFAGGPVVRTRCSHCPSPGLIPGWGTTILQDASWDREKKRQRDESLVSCQSPQWGRGRGAASGGLAQARYSKDALSPAGPSVPTLYTGM